jgi:hypothetical protein
VTRAGVVGRIGVEGLLQDAGGHLERVPTDGGLQRFEVERIRRAGS